MTSGSENALEQLSKCLEFCQALASKRQHFHLNLTLGTSITISLVEETKKKKKSPSTLKRNLKRKEEFLRKKGSETKDATEK